MQSWRFGFLLLSFSTFVSAQSSVKLIPVPRELHASVVEPLGHGVRVLCAAPCATVDQFAADDLAASLQARYIPVAAANGFPIELTEELAARHGLAIDRPAFDAAFAEHQQLSRQGAEARFRGGLAERIPETTRLHTATHLLQAALRQVLGPHVEQRGSNITAERLRFDCVHADRLTPEQLAAVEALVNAQIARDLPVGWEGMDVAAALAAGAIGLFAARYGDRVKVYTIGDFSKEICGGPHVAHTGALGRFRILKEEAVGAGLRRIRAVLEPAT